MSLERAALDKLAEISRFYGGNPEYVIAGGGNTSFKDNEFLYIKASGTSLAQVKPENFVKMDRGSLAAIWKKDYPTDPDAREAAVLADMMAGRCAGEEAKRPSVETLLHDLLPFSYVVHLHPALVNGLTCSQAGENAATELFPSALWIPSINPGFILSRAVKNALDPKTRIGEALKNHSLIFLQNHGIFAAANTTEEIREIYQMIMETLGKRIKSHPDFGGEIRSFGNSEAIGKEILELAQKTDPTNKWCIKFVRNNQIAAYTTDEAAFRPVSSAFSPDHIVYSGSDPLFVSEVQALERAFKAHLEKTARIPRIIAIRSLGVFGLANSEKNMDNALELFKDTQKIAVFSESFGGPRFMDEDQITFINNWEVEHYRTKVST
jgi:rhamnose utilization protein RhaD (predicted bifunctional aldolase and dehydrogenase)